MYRLIILVIFIMLMAVGAFFFIYQANYSPISNELEECTNLGDPVESGINLVLFADDKSVAEQYKDYFLKFSPFDSYNSKFNFYYIPSYKPECEVYKDVALLCYSKDLVWKAGSCPNDHIIVLNNEFERVLRSSSYLNVMSINVKHPKTVLPHEFGHSFVNLAEEYIPAKLPKNHAGNCVSECTEFRGKIEGCYEGCSLADYKRSIANGVMRTLSADKFGIFDESIIIKKIIELTKGNENKITGQVIEGEANCQDSEYILIEGGYIDGDIEIFKKAIEKGCVGSSGSGGVSFSLNKDKIGEKLEGTITGEFNPKWIFTDVPGEYIGQQEIVGETFESDVKFYLKVPIVEGFNDLEIIDSENNGSASAKLECKYLLGDVNDDGVVDDRDIDYMGRYLEGSVLGCRENADVDKNGNINLDDIIGISKIVEENKNIRAGNFEENSPSIAAKYVSPTLLSGAYTNNDFFEVNASFGNTNITNLAITAYDYGLREIGVVRSADEQGYAIFSNLTEGVYFFDAVFTESDGEVVYLEKRNLTIDRTKPFVSLIYPIGGMYNQSITKMEYLINDSALEKCWYALDGVKFDVQCGRNTSEINVANGEHMLGIFARDKAGNEGGISVNFLIDDGTFNVISFGNLTAENNAFIYQNWVFVDVIVNLNNESSIIFELSNTSGVLNRSEYNNKARQITWANLANGTYYYRVIAKDAYGREYETPLRAIYLGQAAMLFYSPKQNFFDRITGWIVKRINGLVIQRIDF